MNNTDTEENCNRVFLLRNFMRHFSFFDYIVNIDFSVCCWVNVMCKPISTPISVVSNFFSFKNRNCVLCIFFEPCTLKLARTKTTTSYFDASVTWLESLGKFFLFFSPRLRKNLVALASFSAETK